LTTKGDDWSREGRTADRLCQLAGLDALFAMTMEEYLIEGTENKS
jgi:hypothetical protein